MKKKSSFLKICRSFRKAAKFQRAQTESLKNILSYLEPERCCQIDGITYKSSMQMQGTCPPSAPGPRSQRNPFSFSTLFVPTNVGSLGSAHGGSCFSPGAEERRSPFGSGSAAEPRTSRSGAVPGAHSALPAASRAAPALCSTHRALPFAAQILQLFASYRPVSCFGTTTALNHSLQNA